MTYYQKSPIKWVFQGYFLCIYPFIYGRIRKKLFIICSFERDSNMKTNRFLVFMVIFLLLVILTGGGLLAYKHFFAQDKSYLGTWERQIDLRGYVIENMNEWFADPTVSAHVEYDDTQVTVKTVLKLTADGKYTENIDAESYEKAAESAKLLAVSGLRSFLEVRLQNAGTNATDIGKTVDELIEEALSMTAAEYLDEKGPSLLPPLDSLKSMYDISGSYEVKDGIMKRSSRGKAVCESYFTKDDYLMFTAPAEDIFEKSLGQSMDGSDTDLKMLYDYPVMYTKD